MSSRQHDDSEGERRRQPQSLNQKNAELLQKLARLRAQKQSASQNPHSIQLNSAFESVAEPMDAPPQNEGKGLGKVKISGRRRLCKVTNNNEETLNSHSPASDDDSTIFESSGENYKRESNVECGGLHKNNRPDKIASSITDETKSNVDELSSMIRSLNIKNSRPAEIGQPKSVVENRTRIIDTFNSFKDSSHDESSQDEEYAYADENHKAKGYHGEKFAYHDEETNNALNSPDYSSDAPDFESAHSVLSSKVDDGEENSAESSEFISSSVGTDAGDHGTSVKLVKSKMETIHNTFEDDDLEDIPSKVVKQNTKVSQVYPTVEVSSSVEELDSVLSESENVFPDAAESVKIKTKSHASTTRRSSARNAYEVVDSDEEEVNSEEVDSIIFCDDKKTYTLPGKIAKKLYAHQREGIKWFWNLHCKCRGGILGDDMGLGKTMQASAFLAGLFSSGLIKRALIVAPKTLIAHWLKELSFVGLGRKTRDYSGSPGSARDYALLYVLQTGGILLTTYDVVRNNWKAIRGEYQGSDEYGEFSEDVPTWDYVILDEGHIIKNPSTQRAKSLREIPSKHRIIISGTPIQNNLREMWALFDFCCPKLLGDKKEFKARYEDLILRANDKKASERHKWIGSKAAEELRVRIQPYFLRRMKSQVFPESGDGENMKLAKKDDIIVWLKLTENQRKLYTAFLKSEAAISSVEGSALAALTVLKKICDHPGLLTKRATDDIAEGMESMLGGEDNVPTEDLQEVALAEEIAISLASNGGLEDVQSKSRSMSCKIEFLMALLENLIAENHRVLIFAQTRKMLNIIQEEIKCKGYDFVRIDGTAKAHDREKLVNEFQTNDAIPIFLLTSQVGGLGLTLTGADRVVVIDPAWNPSTDNQSVDRAYRIGQLRNVLVYRLMTCGTIEEKIYRKQVFKGGLFRTATEHKQQTRYFSQQELHELFTIPESGFDVSLTQKQLHEEHDSQHEIDDTLKNHIEFLEDQGIAGVSHHNLLYSKTETVEPPPPEEDNAVRRYEFTGPVWRYPPSKPLQADAVAGSEFAFRPQDHRHIRLDTAVIDVDDDELKKCAIKENLSRLEKTLADKDLVVRLPDKGENLHRRMRDLTNQLKNLESISSGSVVVVPERSSDSTIPGDTTSVISLDSGSEKQMDVNSLKENLQRMNTNSFHNNDNVINLDDISQGISKLSV